AAEAPPAAAAPPVQPLSRVLGQDRAVGLLRDAIASKRIHHAWIFHGPAGVGKCTAALAFAGALLDPTTDASGASTGESDAGHLVRAGAHPDLHFVRKELAAVSRDDAVRRQKQTTIPKAVAEEFVIEPAARTRRVECDSLAGKVFIVDEADRLAAPGQNALLKTLEEPPVGAVLILVTTHEERLLPTIRSRCQRVAFTWLGDDAMDAWLDRQTATPDPSAEPSLALAPKLAETLDPARLAWLRSFAAGSPGLFREALDTGLHDWHEKLEPMLAAVDHAEFDPALGPAMHALVEERAAAVASADARASKDVANREAAAQLFRLLAERFRGRLRGQLHEHSDGALGELGALEALGVAERRLAQNVQLGFVFDELSGALTNAHSA
ncbi:MAG: AAA family ATPase, partial [Planctomycetota bacterium]